MKKADGWRERSSQQPADALDIPSQRGAGSRPGFIRVHRSERGQSQQPPVGSPPASLQTLTSLSTRLKHKTKWPAQNKQVPHVLLGNPGRSLNAESWWTRQLARLNASRRRLSISRASGSVGTPHVQPADHLTLSGPAVLSRRRRERRAELPAFQRKTGIKLGNRITKRFKLNGYKKIKHF